MKRAAKEPTLRSNHAGRARVELVSHRSAAESLLRRLGKAAMRADIDIGEGFTEPGVVISPNDPARRLG
jgi:hypothetical protein